MTVTKTCFTFFVANYSKNGSSKLELKTWLIAHQRPDWSHAKRSANMERQINWMKTLLDDSTLSSSERLNCQSYLSALQCEEIVDHEGRYLLIKDGEIYPESFLTPQDTFRDELDDLYGIFYIPTKDELGECGATLNYYEATSGRIGDSFEEPTVPITFSAHDKITNTTIKDSEKNYLVDTGASDTTCPTTFKFEGEKDSQHSWRPLAFWGTSHIACRKSPPISCGTAGGDVKVYRLYFEKGQLKAEIPNCPQVDVNSVVIQTPFLCSPKVGKLTSKPVEPKSSKLLLGRDILFKHFNLSITKPVGESAKVNLTPRTPTTPPKQGFALKSFQNVLSSMKNSILVSPYIHCIFHLLYFLFTDFYSVVSNYRGKMWRNNVVPNEREN